MLSFRPQGGVIALEQGLQVGPVVAPPQTRRSPARLRRWDVLEPCIRRRLRDLRVAPRGRFVGGGRRLAWRPALVPQVPYQVGQRLVPLRFRWPPFLAGDWPARWYAGFLAGPPPR